LSAGTDRARYLPREDTYLLRDALAPFGGGSCLEIGFGTGVVLESVSGRFALAVGTDIVALEDARMARSRGMDLVLADKATPFRDGVFDIVFFNPPYLRSAKIEDAATDGGPLGVDVPISFLVEGLRVSKEEGTIVALVSSEGDVESFLLHCENLGLEVESIAKKGVFFETLSVLTIRRRQS
jgi:HemK-related putative methylase